MEDKIKVEHVSKAFKMYNSSMDKMKEALCLTKKTRHTVFYAVKDLSFQVKQGEILGIMGRNGSGKSTLLKMITGIYEPTEGNISVSGKISSLLELGTGFNMEYTGIENIFFYGTLMGFDKAQMQEKLSGIIAFAEIGDYIYQPIKTYSSGMFARLAFSCAINVEPEILIVDEILSVGDMRFQAKCFNKFKEFREKNVTILYVGHDVGMMRSFCNRTMWINQGKLVEIGDPTYVSAKYTEFMYQDDLFAFTDYKRTEDASKKEELPKSEPRKIKESLFPDSIAHWGTETGMVRSAAIQNHFGREQTVFHAEETMQIVIGLDIRAHLNMETFSVAFSIKNKEGTDIIVKTTYDEQVQLKTGSDQWIRFAFTPRLSNGDYYLVVALENRENREIQYYEYIEGAVYFKMYTDKKIFGVYDVPTQIQLIE